MLNRAYLSLGSNIEPEHHLSAAVRLLSGHGNVVAVSQVWETAPVGFADQPNFLNAAVLLETVHTAEDVQKTVIVDIESVLKRERDPGNRNAPRTIDVDLTLFNDEILRLGRRRVPDPDLLARAFVAVPLAELQPDYVHPETAQTLSRIAAALRRDAPGMMLRPDVILATF